MVAASLQRSEEIQRTAGGFVHENCNHSAPKDNRPVYKNFKKKTTISIWFEIPPLSDTTDSELAKQ